MRFAVEKCASVFRGYQSAVETITGYDSYITSHLMLKINGSVLGDFIIKLVLCAFLVILNSLSQFLNVVMLHRYFTGKRRDQS